MQTYEGRILDIGGAVFNVRSSVYGAKGDGVTDDTPAIQNAVNAAFQVGGTVLIPPGVYVVTQLVLEPGITISGYGATLLRPPRPQMTKEQFDVWRFTRTLTVTHLGSWDRQKDSKPLVIRGLTIDGNSANQGDYRNWELEQMHLIFLWSHGEYPVRLRATLQDLVLRNSVADGISVYTNVDAQVMNCRADDCFRGGVNVTGGYSVVQVQNLITTGRTDRTGIDIEVDGLGFGPTLKVEITLDGVVLDGDFDVTVSQGSTVKVSNVISGPGFYLEAPDSAVSIANSRFQVAGSGGSIVFPHDVTFDGCVFELLEASRCARIQWNSSLPDKLPHQRQRLRFRNCDFRPAAGANVTVGTAIWTEGDLKAHDNRLIVEGGSISSAFDTGLRMISGGTWIIKDIEIDAATAFDWEAKNQFPTGATADIRIERVYFRGTTYMLVRNFDMGNTLDQRDVVLDEAQKLTSVYGLAGNVYRGGRLIRVATSPIGRNVPAFAGDRARLAAPVAGQPYEWVAVDSSDFAATWKQVTALSA